MYVNVDPKGPVVFIEGWLERLSQSQEWRRYWCILKDNIIYFFASQRPSENTLEGSIALGPESRLEKLDGDQKSGYKFHLHTKRSLNTFKVSKYADRERWKACVEGIALGRFSDTIDLLPGQKEEIRNLLEEFLTNRQKSTSASKQQWTECNLKDGFDTPNSSTSGCFASNKDTLGYLIPIQRTNSVIIPSQKYKFHADPSRTDVPSWFFASCTRELAQKILTVGGAFGNTLMREGTSGTKNLVISKRMETSSSGQDFTHYILQSTSQGYKIDVENYHEPMKSLSEVMNFFIATSGKMTTRPMECNDLHLLGIADPVYNVKIVATTDDTQFSAIHDPDSGEETGDITDAQFSFKRGPPDVIAPSVPHISKNNMQQHSTWGPPDVIAPSVPHISKNNMQQHSTWGPPDVIAPSVPHISKNNMQQHSTWGPPDVIAPSVPHISKNNMQQHSTWDSHGRWSSRSTSIPNISSQNVKQIQATRLSKDKLTSVSQIIQKHSPLVEDVPPPLPPNHPKPKKSFSQSELKLTPDLSVTNVKKIGPKHTQSMGSADNQTRKTSPRDQHSASKARNELLNVVARINKQEESEAVPMNTQPEIEYDLEECVRSPKNVKEDFKKTLAGIIGSQQIPGLRPHISNNSTDPSDNYESIAHYQNAHEIQNVRK